LKFYGFVILFAQLLVNSDFYMCYSNFLALLQNHSAFLKLTDLSRLPQDNFLS